jgi:Tol biopolymer transport system component
LVAVLVLAMLAVFVGESDSSRLGATGAEAGAVSGVVLADNGRIIAVNADGSGIRTLTVPPADLGDDDDPAASPDGSLIAFVRDGERVKVMRANGSGLRDVGEGLFAPEWAPDGTLLAYSTGKTVVVVRPDGSDRRVVTSDQNMFGFTWSPDSTSIAYPSSDGISVVNVRTGGERLLFEGEDAWRPAWSPDGSRIAFLGSLQGDDAYERVLVMNTDGSGVREVGPDPLSDTPDWSPDSTRLAFSTFASPESEHISVAVVELSSGHTTTLIPPLAGRDSRSPSWSPEGDRIAFLRSGEQGGDVWVAHADGRNEIQLTRQFPVGGSSSVPRWLPATTAVKPDRPLPLAALRTASSLQLGDRYDLAAVELTAAALITGSGDHGRDLGIWRGRGAIDWIENKAKFSPQDVALAGKRVYWSYYVAERDGRTWSGLYTATWPSGRTVRLRYMENKPGVTVAGNGSLVVYTLGHSLWKLDGTVARRIRHEDTDLWPLSVNAGRALIGNRHLRLEVIDSGGKLLAALPQPKNFVSARLSGNRLIVLTKSKIRVYRLPSGTLRSTRPVGAIGFADAAGIPYGPLFPYKSEQHWHVLNLDTGRDKIVTIDDQLSPLTTAITSSGLYYTAIPQYSTVKGEVGLVPLSAVRRAVR